MAIIDDKVKFEQALKQEACDVVDSMLSQGYIPDPECIKIVCKHGNLVLLETLLKYPMAIQGALFVTCYRGQHQVLNRLYLAGSNVNFSSQQGYTPLHLARDGETCRWLLDMGAKQTPNEKDEMPLHIACLHGKLEVVEVLLTTEMGIHSISLKDYQGYNPLNNACYRQAEIVKLLLSYKQSIQTINQPNIFGISPLARAQERPEILVLLQHALNRD